MKATSLQPIMRCAAVLTASLILMSTAQAANQYKVLHYFGNRPAQYPEGTLVSDSAGNLYGTTLRSSPDKCGNQGCGTVFKLTRQSGGMWAYSMIYRFNGPDGEWPIGSLISDPSGNLYGITEFGGAMQQGTIFELSLSGNTWKEKVLYNFDLPPGLLAGGLLVDANGNLYGNSQSGGKNFKGEVFELSPSGNQWKYTAIYTFSGGADGSGPSAGLIQDASGNLYGTTANDGASGFGTVFELTPSGSGWTETVLYSFSLGRGGNTPLGGVTFDTAGNLYGTTIYGGLFKCKGGNGCGTVFQLTPSMGHWTHSVLHAFDRSDGQTPQYNLTFDSAGSLYGATSAGGKANAGVVFKLTQSGGQWSETTLHLFDNKRGAQPTAGLILDQQGVVYGTASVGGLGGNPGYGVVFSLTP